MPDERFDLFTRLATWLFDVPIAAINLVDADRTFFKSLIGLPRYEPRRCTAICAYAVAGHEPTMVVEDLAQDARFHDNPVVAAGFRFYAGAVLLSPAGHALGTLCIFDRQPRLFSVEDRNRLLELAKGVGAVLELHRTSLQLLRMASQDSLTGLCNRRLFVEVLEAAVARPRPAAPIALLCLDVDHFKQVNDRFGHAGGDTLLREIGRRLGRVARPQDRVARLGGDEFAILLGGRGTLRRAEQLAKDVLAAFKEPFRIENELVTIGTSIGVALYPDDAADAEDLLRCADDALYEAKRSGRGRYGLNAKGMARVG